MSPKKPSEYLAPRASKPRPRRIVTFDIESKCRDSQNKGFERAFLVGFYDGDPHDTTTLPPNSPKHAEIVGYKGFRNHPSRKAEHAALPSIDRAIARGGCVDAFCRYLFGHRGDWQETARLDLTKRYARIYAHNGGAFDFSYILAWLQKHQFEFQYDCVIVQSRALMITIARHANLKTKGPHHRWELVDSVFLMPMSLQDIGKSFNAGDKLAQKAADFDIDTHEKSEEWEIYNAADCRTLFAGVQKFSTLVDDLGGALAITAASTAMSLFRQKYLKEPISRSLHFPKCGARTIGKPKRAKKKRRTCGSDACLQDWILEGYCGGRVEVFTLRYGRSFRGWDINSSYPFSMLSPMPSGYARMLGREKVSDFLQLRDMRRRGNVGFVECDVYVPPSCSIPPLPVKCADGKLRFPTGHFHGIWTDDELALLEDPFVGGRITAVTKSVWYESSFVFAEYVRDLYAIRQDAKKHPNDPLKAAMSAVAKILINALYGKTAERKGKEKLVLIPTDLPMPGDDGCPYFQGKPLLPNEEPGDAVLWVVNEYKDRDHICPQLAAYVTSRSRIKLWQALKIAVQLGATIYYCDSDSIRVGAPNGLTKDSHTAWYVEFEAAIGVDDSALGAWSREYDGKNLAGKHHRPKLYRLLDDDSCATVFGGKQLTLKAKGIPKRERTAKNFETLVNGGRIDYTRRMMPRTILKEGASAPVDVATHKSVSSEFDKRVPLLDGSTRPIEYAKRTREDKRRKRNHGAEVRGTA